MTCSNSALSVTRTSTASSQIDLDIPPIRVPRPEQTVPIASNSLERLSQLMLSNDRLMDELVTSRARIVAARNYLDRVDCNPRFGSAHLERCRTKHSGILAQLRANRIEALQLLADDGSGA
jgi:hypothetical protein